MDPLIGEAQAALLALNLVVHHQHTFVLFEADSFQVIEAIELFDPQLYLLGGLL